MASDLNTFPFLRLPAEIRTQVYKVLFTNNHIALCGNSRLFQYDREHCYEGAILRTCKQIYDEARALLLDTVYVRLTGGPLCTWTRPQMIDASPSSTNLIPSNILKNLTVVETNIDSLPGATFFKQECTLKILRLRDSPAKFPSIADRLLRVCPASASRNNMAKLTAGDFDEDIVRLQAKNLSNSVHLMRFRRLFGLCWQREDRGGCLVLVVTRGYIWEQGVTIEKEISDEIYEREITYDYDTLEICHRRNVRIEEVTTDQTEDYPGVGQS